MDEDEEQEREDHSVRVDAEGTSLRVTATEGVVPLDSEFLLLPLTEKQTETMSWTCTPAVAAEPPKCWPAESGRRRHSGHRVQVAACVVVVAAEVLWWKK